MLKKIFWVPVKTIYGVCYCWFWLVKWTVKIVWWLAAAPLRLLWRCLFCASTDRQLSQPMIDAEKILPLPAPIEPRPAEKIGNIINYGQDHNLRIFTILNAEGEIYRIDTQTPGAFYGPVWTHIFSCYEARLSFKARLVKPVYGRSGHPSGYQVKIGSVKAFMPNYHSLHKNYQRPINIRIAVLAFDPTTRKLTVSARLAYESIFADKPLPEEGSSSQALCWDYNEEFIYMLLPGELMGRARYHGSAVTAAAMMGELVTCQVDFINPKQAEALLTIEESTEWQSHGSMPDMYFDKPDTRPSQCDAG